MHINQVAYRTIWDNDGDVELIDQRLLPFEFRTQRPQSSEEMVQLIADMAVRGAPLIGVSGAYGAYLAARQLSERFNLVDEQSHALFEQEVAALNEARPTAVNLSWALKQQAALVERGARWTESSDRLRKNARKLADEDVATSRAMGEHGLSLLKKLASEKQQKPVNVLTHCNAGWLATIDYGTATAPIYLAHQAGIDLHVWVDETRPRLQGAKLTAYELAEEGIPHTIISDSASGYLMQQGQVDICFVGTDRTTRTGDVANKIGTYKVALAAHDNNVPFYVCAPSSSIDWACKDGLTEIPIEQRNAEEVTHVTGLTDSGEVQRVRISNPKSSALNVAFDVTPARLVSGLITERGIAKPDEASLLELFPEQRS